MALYRGILEREADQAGLTTVAKRLERGDALEDVIRTIVASPEFQSRQFASLVPSSPLPDLTRLMPDRYEVQEGNGVALTVYRAQTDPDVERMPDLIDAHRYYDRFGVWSPLIDLDKEISAAIVRGLGARSCFELGCFTGPVLSLLAGSGLDVLGCEVSHTAFAFAYPNIRNEILFGDLLNLEIPRRFDVILCMDVLEHVNPLRLESYIAKLSSLLNDDGFIYVNSPMWGPDETFGLFEPQYLAEWRAVGDRSFWRHWPCDEQGWPLHGHLIWASPGWWTRKFSEADLIRDRVIEEELHRQLGEFFKHAVGRRCLFVLRRADNHRSSSEIAAAIGRTLARIERP